MILQAFLSGAESQNRTGDTRFFRPVLYQLSYLGIAFAHAGLRDVDAVPADLCRHLARKRSFLGSAACSPQPRDTLEDTVQSARRNVFDALYRVSVYRERNGAVGVAERL